MDARTQEKDLYLFPCFPPTVPAFQLPTGNAAHFSIGKCHSNKTYVSFVGGSETLWSIHLPENLSVFSTTHQSFVKLYFAFAEQIHHWYIQFIPHLCVLNIFLASVSLQAMAFDCNTEHPAAWWVHWKSPNRDPQRSLCALFCKKNTKTQILLNSCKLLALYSKAAIQSIMPYSKLSNFKRPGKETQCKGQANCI